MLSNAPVQVGHSIKLSDMSESEIHFGIAPKRGPGVTYQDNIILMEQGDKAIQSYGSDGLTWTLDANAPQVSDIQVGKVLFATDRCAGKVLSVQHNGGSVQVVLGPVLLNELVKEGNFAYDQPLDLNNAIAVVAPDYAGALGSKAMNDEMQKPESRGAALQRGFKAIRNYEESLSLEMLRVLNDCGAVVYGVTDKKRIPERVPTLCFNLPNISPARVGEELARQNIGIRDGHMYTPRLMKRLGLTLESGAVRASLVHYNTVEEVRRFGSALSEIASE